MSYVRKINQGRVYYFLAKPCNETELAIAIRMALEHGALWARLEQQLFAEGSSWEEEAHFAENP